MSEPGKAERIVKLLNYMYKDGYSGGLGGQFLDFGAEGIHHKSENGKITGLLPQLAKDQNDYMTPYTMGGVPNNHDVIKLQATKSEYESFEKMNAERSKGNQIVSYFYSTLPFSYDGDKYVKEASLKFIYGKEDFSKWDEYVKTLNERYQFTKVQEIRTQELKDLGLLK
ncbi:hypothetical protein [Paenibacillus agricola]|uniref:Uncharacterized protein n=1 Tax=Paenibacillus agricola TaxID=2716264 RepID=A0ABX0JCL5_9BACL|nr:hypothetical protein [Paenibacillus agricola]NHN31425.1 hypothetical protein [Paenibacillus agricola]